jgi:hypothetical protein
LPSADWAPAECARWCVLISRGSRFHASAVSFTPVGRQCRQSVILALRPAVFDRHVAAIDLTGFTEPFEKSREGPRVSPGKSGIEKTNHRHCAVLRARGQQPGGGNSAARIPVASWAAPQAEDRGGNAAIAAKSWSVTTSIGCKPSTVLSSPFDR